ncbi:MAG: hypothetical protein ACR2PG_17975, partial [Hyphomicrobiaceae bacterium]
LFNLIIWVNTGNHSIRILSRGPIRSEDRELVNMTASAKKLKLCTTVPDGRTDSILGRNSKQVCGMIHASRLVLPVHRTHAQGRPQERLRERDRIQHGNIVTT